MGRIMGQGWWSLSRLKEEWAEIEARDGPKAVEDMRSQDR